MNEHTLQNEMPQPSCARSLKIEADGDFFRGRIKPKIRIMGKWLERAGFKPGGRVQIIFVSPGVMQLRSADVLMLNESGQMSGCGLLQNHDRASEPPQEAILPPEKTGSVEPKIPIPHTVRRNDPSQRTPDQFAFCGPHFYNSSPRTRALGTYWQNCAHCGQALGYFGTCEEAQASKRDCVPLSAPTIAT